MLKQNILLPLVSPHPEISHSSSFIGTVLPGKQTGLILDDRVTGSRNLTKAKSSKTKVKLNAVLFLNNKVVCPYSKIKANSQ